MAVSRRTTVPTEQAIPAATTGMPTTTGRKIDIFSKAKAATSVQDKKTKEKATCWYISPEVTPDKPTRDQLNDAIAQLHDLYSQTKVLETKQNVFKSMLRPYALDRFFESMAESGVLPPAPLKVISDKGQSITLVLQDRSASSKVTDEQIAALEELVGDRAADLIYDAGEFSFNANIMAQNSPTGGTVQDVVAEAIGDAISQLLEAKKISEVQADGLLSYSAEKHFKPQPMARAVEFVGRNAEKLAEFAGILDKSFISYVKAG